ncbi:hypothetical protein BGZ92_005663 [Podila epicladia]|nr:hypothetical protein BGZ92_005663 [Podila epicladia]
MSSSTAIFECSEATSKGLAKAVFKFKHVPFKARTTPLAGAQEDDEKYGRGGYATAVGIPTGLEFTIEVAENGTKKNDLIRGCQGGCEQTPWYMGFDEGFAALAGVRVERPTCCSMSLASTGSVDNIREEILRACDTRCANFIYGTTLELSRRIDPPGYRTLVALLCNWGAWLSCSMYDSLTKWSSNKGDSFTWADTLHTSKIHFVDAELRHIGRPHENGLLNKGPGWDDDGSLAWIKTCKKYGLRGTFMRQTIGMYVLMVEVGMHGKSTLAWSCMTLDTKFAVDYNLASDNSPCRIWCEYLDKYSYEASVGALDLPTSDEKYVASYAVGCSFSFGAIQVKQRREHEAGKSHTVRRGGVVWEDRKLWSSFLVADSGAVQMALIAGGCVDDLANIGMVRVINDVVDLGYDWSSGDVGNSILTLTKGKTDRISLSRAYVKVAAVLNRMASLRPDTVGSVAVITTHAWQMCNTRHRAIACSMVSNDAGLGRTEVSASWHEAAVLDLDPTKKASHAIKSGELFGKQVDLTDRSWKMIGKDTTGMVAKMLYHGHIWLIEQRQERKVASAQEICDAEDIIRILLVTMAMEFERADFIEALWCWTIESWCASDMMWHAMIGSTTLSSKRQVGSDHWDDENNMKHWA